jgi:hypothetical protein
MLSGRHKQQSGQAAVNGTPALGDSAVYGVLHCHRFIMTWVVDLVPPLSACDDCGSTMNNRRRAHTAGWMFSFYGNAQVLVLPVLGEKKFKRSLFLVFNEYSLCPRINAILAFKLCPSKLATSD